MFKAITIGWSHFQSASNKPQRLCLICRCGLLLLMKGKIHTYLWTAPTAANFGPQGDCEIVCSDTLPATTLFHLESLSQPPCTTLTVDNLSIVKAAQGGCTWSLKNGGNSHWLTWAHNPLRLKQSRAILRPTYHKGMTPSMPCHRPHSQPYCYHVRAV